MQAALITRLTAASPGAAIPAASIHFANKSFTPGSVRWYRATFLPGIPVAAAIGAAGQNRHVGIFQVDLFEPKNIGDGLARVEAERIVACFKRGTVLTYSGVSVMIQESHREAGREDGDWFHIPVIIQFWGDVDN